MSEKELSQQEEQTLNSVTLDNATPELDPIVSAASLIAAEGSKKKRAKKASPAKHDDVMEKAIVDDDPPTSMADTRWHDYVMRQFSEDELDPKGRPFVHGLRRVARLLLGPILSSKPRVVQSPTFANGTLKLTPAVVEYEVEFLWCVENDLKGGGSYPVTFGGAADVYQDNTDPDFARHASSTAETKAEGRALRKALGLGRIIAAEESTLVPYKERGSDDKIDNDQILWLDIVGQRHDLNIMAVVNANKDGKIYRSVWDVEYELAASVCEFCTGITNNRSKIKPEWTGYIPNWKERKK